MPVLISGTRPLPRRLLSRRLASVAASSVGLLMLTACGSDSASPTDPNGGTPGTTPPVQTVAVTFTPCVDANNLPMPFVAYQDGTGAWKRSIAQNGTFSMAFGSAKGAVAYTEDYGGGSYSTQIEYGTIQELQQSLNWGGCTSYGSNSIVVKGLTAGQTAAVSLGYNANYVSGPGDKTAALTAPVGATSLMAVVGKTDTAITRMVLRRGVASGTAAQTPVDFSAAESFAPVPGTLRFTGGGELPNTVSMWFQATGARHQILGGRPVPSATMPIFGVPAERALAGEMYEVYAYYPSASIGAVSASRYAHGYSATSDNFDVPNAVLPATAPATNIVSTSGYVRGRMTWTAPDNMKSVGLGLSGRTDKASMYLYYSRAYLGSTTVDVTAPDLSGIAGWSNNYAPKTGQQISLSNTMNTWSAATGGFYMQTQAGNVGTSVSWNSTITP